MSLTKPKKLLPKPFKAKLKEVETVFEATPGILDAFMTLLEIQRANPTWLKNVRDSVKDVDLKLKKGIPPENFFRLLVVMWSSRIAFQLPFIFFVFKTVFGSFIETGARNVGIINEALQVKLYEEFIKIAHNKHLGQKRVGKKSVANYYRALSNWLIPYLQKLVALYLFDITFREMKKLGKIDLPKISMEKKSYEIIGEESSDLANRFDLRRYDLRIESSMPAEVYNKFKDSPIGNKFCYLAVTDSDGSVSVKINFELKATRSWSYLNKDATKAEFAKDAISAVAEQILSDVSKNANATTILKNIDEQQVGFVWLFSDFMTNTDFYQNLKLNLYPERAAQLMNWEKTGLAPKGTPSPGLDYFSDVDPSANARKMELLNRYIEYLSDNKEGYSKQLKEIIVAMNDDKDPVVQLSDAAVDKIVSKAFDKQLDDLIDLAKTDTGVLKIFKELGGI